MQEDAAQEQDPQTSTMSTEQGTEVNVTELLSSGSVAQTDQVTIGIDGRPGPVGCRVILRHLLLSACRLSRIRLCFPGRRRHQRLQCE